MNKTILAAIAFLLLMAGATYLAVGAAGGMGAEGDWVNKLGIFGAVALFVITTVVVVRFVKQMQNDTASGKLADESWDSIGEYKNEAPFGYSVIYFGLIIWAIWYMLAGYPLGSYSQIGEYNKDVAAHEKKFEAEYAEKVKDPEFLKEMGESAFNSNCAACHGLQADGINGKAADLHERLSQQAVKHVLMNGANNNLLGANMPMPDRNGLLNTNTNALITDAEIDTVSKYVAGGLKADDASGAAVFAGACAACHGADGKGMDMVAPNIAVMSPAMVEMVLKHGKKGVIGKMPAFTNLTDIQVKAIGAYVSSLSQK